MKADAQTFRDHERPTQEQRRENLERGFFVRQISGMLTQVQEQLGPHGIALLEQYAKGKLTPEQLQHELEVAPDFRAFQQGVLKFFESRGFVSSEGDTLLVETEKIKNFIVGFDGERKPFGTKPDQEFLDTFSVFHQNNTRNFLFYGFFGKKVVDKKEWEAHQQDKSSSPEPTPIDLFYSPQSTSAAFDPEEIRASEFYIAPWEIPVSIEDEETFPAITNQDFSLLEASVACYLYHPNFLDGKRDQNGNLIIRTKDGTQKKITAEDLTRLAAKNQRAKQLSSRPRSFLLEGNFSNLQESGLLLPEDFGYLSTEEKNARHIYKDITHQKGYVTIEGVRYTLGTRFGPTEKKQYRVYKISEKQAGIVERDLKTEQETLVAHFVLLPKEKEHPLRKKYHDAPLVEVGKRSLKIETPSQEMADNFSDFLEARQKLQKETGLVLSQLSTEEQTRFFTFISENTGQENNFYAFAKEFGLPGIRAFFATAHDPEAAKKILSISERYSLPQATAIFEKYGEFLDAAKGVEQEVLKFAGQGVDQEQLTYLIQQKLFDRAGEVLTTYASEEEPEKRQKTKLFLEQLERFETETFLFGNLFKALYKGKETIDLKEIETLEFGEVMSRDISEEDKQSMMDIIIKNMKSAGEYGRACVASLRRALSDDSDDMRFYLLKKENEVLAYVRFYQQFDQYGAPIPQRKGGGSFNVAPNQRGYALGEAMLLNAIKQEAKDNIIDAFVDPNERIGMRYVEDGDCDIMGTVNVGGKQVFKLMCSRHHRERSHSKDEPREKLIEEFQRQHVSVDQAIKQDRSRIVCRFDPDTDEEHILLTTQKLCFNEYRVVRYFPDPNEKKYRYYVFELDEDRRTQKIRRNMRL